MNGLMDSSAVPHIMGRQNFHFASNNSKVTGANGATTGIASHMGVNPLAGNDGVSGSSTTTNSNSNSRELDGSNPMSRKKITGLKK